MKIVQPSVTLVHATPDPARVIERMGRICYQSDHKVKTCCHCSGDGCCECLGTGTDEQSAIDFIRMVIKRGHESVLEHVSAGFRIVTDRGVTHELVRHRIASFSQESTRYCDYAGNRFGGELSFVEPPGLDGRSGLDRENWQAACRNAENSYRLLRANGIAPEYARSVLPNSLKAEIGMTCNAREWRHFLRLRTAKAAHPQMHQVANMISDHLMQWCPVLFEDVLGGGQ